MRNVNTLEIIIFQVVRQYNFYIYFRHPFRRSAGFEALRRIFAISGNNKYMEVVQWKMDLLRNRAIFKAKMVICWISITMGALYALNSSRNRLLITFARSQALAQKLKNGRSKSAFFACNSALCRLLWIYLYLCLYEPINTLQVRLKLARLDRLRNCKRYPGEVRQVGIYEQIMKSCQNQG